MMINDIYSKWKELILKNDEKLNISAFYVTKKCPSKLFLGYDGKRKHIFLEFDEEVLLSFKCPKTKGLDISIKNMPMINEKKKYIQITNDDDKDEVFLAFCSTLYDNLKECTTFFDVAESLNATLKYYKTYFSNPNKPLTEEEERGLFCELVYLEKLLGKYGQEAIKYWEGPNKNKRDFVLPNSSIEVKSTINQLVPSIRISNELQLDNTYPENINLFLKVFILEKNEDADSLIKAAKRIEAKLIDIEAKKSFLQKLMMDRVDLKLYEDMNNYIIQQEMFYKVDDTFPSIKRNQLDQRIFKVEYYLNLSNLKENEASE